MNNGVQTVDETIEQIENLYQTVTGRPAPVADDTEFAPIPPEKDPEVYVGEQIERLMEALGPLSGGRPAPRSAWTPPLSAWQGGSELILHLDLPGITLESVRVRLSSGVLEVSGRRAPIGPNGSLSLQHNETPFGTFHRAIPIAPDLATDELEARLKDGVLTIRIPRSGSNLEMKEIPVG